MMVILLNQSYTSNQKYNKRIGTRANVRFAVMSTLNKFSILLKQMFSMNMEIRPDRAKLALESGLNIIQNTLLVKKTNSMFLKNFQKFNLKFQVG